MRWIRLLLVALLFSSALFSSAQATNPNRCFNKFNKYGCESWRRCYSTTGCGPLCWCWKLPPGNGHYWAPNPCIGPAYTYSPAIPPYYRGPELRTIDQPMVDEEAPTLGAE